jgi:hypothetical protein
MRAVSRRRSGKAVLVFEEPILVCIGDDDNAAGRRLGADPRRQRSTGHALTARAFEGVPETAAQRVAHLVVQQKVDRQRRTLQQPCLQVGGHPRLSREHRFQPERGRVAGHGVAELQAFATAADAIGSGPL